MRFIIFTALFFSMAAHGAESAAIDSVRVIKSAHQLQLLHAGTVVKQFHVVFGANPEGAKQQEGDGKTPEGKYTLDFKKEDSAFYKAIHVSYPNSTDTEAAKKRGVSPGGAIMIHGQKNGLGWLSFVSQRFNWTNGCIGLSNEDMAQVWEAVNVPMPIEIVP